MDRERNSRQSAPEQVATILKILQLHIERLNPHGVLILELQLQGKAS
jgi:hypothetical protein